ncbi:LuxR C-terminal-related transcriptional regulator [Pseudonocardia sp. GCM10023141]|uniref:LuxR C-terminal-related transcriptional regulator n=1 Tax=Pseudonocardia sp. GCM10023141 TaxID=3252653 RepID=UPI00361890EC
MAESTAAVTVVLVCSGAARTAEALGMADVTVVGRATQAVEAARLVGRHRPDVAVVDLDTAGAEGSAAIAAVADVLPPTPVLAVSAHADHAAVLAAVSAGAAGFLVWSAGATRLVAAVRRVAAGEAVFSPGLADVVLEAHGRLSGPEAAARLTDREADVLRLVVEGLTGRQIASRLVLSPRTVENHVQHLLRKLGLPNRAALVRYAIEQGLA